MILLRYYIYYIFLHITLAGSSLIQIGDAVSTHLDSSATVKYSSNIFRTETGERTDTIYKLSPGLFVNFGKPGAKLDFNIKANYDLLKYQDLSDLDINLSKFFINGIYNHSEVFTANFSYSDVDSRSTKSEIFGRQDAPSLIETFRESYSFNTQYKYSHKLSLSLGYNRSNLTFDAFHADQLSSIRTTTIPVYLSLMYSNKLNFLYGISLTHRDISARDLFLQGSSNPIPLPAYETDSIYYNVGLKGSILPKLTGEFNIGVRTLSFSTPTDDFDSLGANSSLTWTLTPKLRTTLNLSRDFDASGSGSTYRHTTCRLSTVFSLSNEYKLSWDVFSREKFYRANPSRPGDQIGRDETLVGNTINLHYVPSQFYSFVAGFNSIRSNAVDDYDLREFSITAKLKY